MSRKNFDRLEFIASACLVFDANISWALALVNESLVTLALHLKKETLQILET